MNLVLVLNELSEHPRADDQGSAKRRMDQLVDTLGKLRTGVGRLAPKPTLRCREDFFNWEIADGYTIARWLRDADRDRRVVFQSFATASPVLLTAAEGGGGRDQYMSEATHGGEPAAGLHSAWLWDGVALSLPSSEHWNAPTVAIEVATIGETGDVSRVTERVRHASHPTHVSSHDSWFEEQARLSVADVSDLWRRRVDLFPHLEFCRQVEANLRMFDAGSPHFRQIMSRLFALDRAFRDWDRRPLHPDFVPGKCTPESPETLREERDDHTATRPSGEDVLFSWHLRFTPDAGRIFFDGDLVAGRGIVGYVGLKKDGKLT